MHASDAMIDDNWINPHMLTWARERRGRSVEDAASRLKKSSAHIVEWESGISHPTVRQARILADYYGRPFLEFLLPETLDQFELPVVPDYRLRAGRHDLEDSWELRDIQRWAVTQRVNALDLYSEIGDVPPTIPHFLFATPNDDPSVSAEHARSALRFPVYEQLALTRTETRHLPTFLRQRLEALGILVMRRSELSDLGIRGICLAEFPLPVIVYGNESPSAQAFTLVHELAHVLLRQSGITGPRVAAYNEQPVERWCDRFAASFLMPADLVTAIIGAPPLRASNDTVGSR